MEEADLDERPVIFVWTPRRNACRLISTRRANDREQAAIAPDFIDPDDAPDLSQEPWLSKIAKAPVGRGRPRPPTSKASVTIPIDADLLAELRSTGPGWQLTNASIRKLPDDDNVDDDAGE
jgi:uncharacterized protein (DUF4415 family)